jgi:hypothetical protein
MKQNFLTNFFSVVEFARCHGVHLFVDTKIFLRFFHVAMWNKWQLNIRNLDQLTSQLHLYGKSKKLLISVLLVGTFLSLLSIEMYTL